MSPFINPGPWAWISTTEAENFYLHFFWCLVSSFNVLGLTFKTFSLTLLPPPQALRMT